MRDLLFKNLTSSDKRRKIILSTEVSEKSGIRTETHRHFVCLIKEVKRGQKGSQPLPSLYIRKERNSKEHRQAFFCRIKGSMYTVSNNQLYMIYFAHTLRINLQSVAHLAEHNC